jgi:hypothetical protein
MKKIHVLIALVGLSALAAVNVSAQVAVPPEAHQWEVPHANGVSYGVDYMLHNQKNKKQIGYENRRMGGEVDLDWVGNFGGLFSFNRKAPAGTRDHRTGPIPENADVAIYNTETRRYLTYQKFDDTVAELEWTSTPSYEWQLRDQKGTSVASFALFNSRVRKYLVLQGKTRGINLGWLNDMPTGPQSFSVTLSAQPIIQGWVPYRGSFGQNTRGSLLTVRNASGSATLIFVKPGQSTSSCGEPRDTVRVAPRAAMTAQQMKILYGSETPRLPITFLACLVTTTTQSVSATSLNITYQLDN